MAITSYRAFLEALADLTIDGVERVYDYPPPALNTADMPTAWVQQPAGEERPLTYQTAGGWPELIAELCVAVEPAAQSMQRTNFYAMVDMLDAVSEALRGADASRGPHSWAVRGATITIGSTAYWGVVARVTGNG